MNRKIAVMTLGILIGFFLAAGASAASGGAKIKVVAEDASVRVQPSRDSEAVEENVALGTVFDSERKIGEWFEVKFRTQLGVDVVCYIHEEYVEVLEGEELPPSPKTETQRMEPARPAPSPVPARGRLIRFGLKLGGGLAAFQSGYSWDHSFFYWGEDLNFMETVSNGAGFGFHGGVGVFIGPVEIETSFTLASKGLESKYKFEVPSIYFFDDYAEAERGGTVNYKASYFSFGVNYHPLRDRRFSPFVGLGGCSVSAAMDLWDKWRITDYYYSDGSHSIEIDEIGTKNVKFKKFGFFFQGGASFQLIPMISLFAQAKYVLAKVEREHLITEGVANASTLKINLGGIFVDLGVKFVF